MGHGECPVFEKHHTCTLSREKEGEKRRGEERREERGEDRRGEESRGEERRAEAQVFRDAYASPRFGAPATYIIYTGFQCSYFAVTIGGNPRVCFWWTMCGIKVDKGCPSILIDTIYSYIFQGQFGGPGSGWDRTGVKSGRQAGAGPLLK